MKIAARYSHLNGWEFLKVHKPKLWKEIEGAVASIDAHTCKTKKSQEARSMGTMFFSAPALNRCAMAEFVKRGWTEHRTSYWVTDDADLIDRTMRLPPKEQKAIIGAAGKTPIFSYNQTDFVKDRVAVEVQFGKYSFVAYDLFVKHMAFYIGKVIDVGVEILPMKTLQEEMTSGVGYYEGELYNLIREGRGVPAVPLVLVGVAP